MPPIHCEAKAGTIGSWTVVILPKSASTKLPSRGMVMVEGTMNNTQVQIPLEPDGKGSHWFSVDKTLAKKTKVQAGDTVTLSIDSLKEWPEPELPDDLQKALTKDTKAQEIWMDVTTKAHWDWIRWIRSTNNPETRKIRIIKTLSKLKGGTRSPCCFNRAMCTEPTVSKNGVLVDPK